MATLEMPEGLTPQDAHQELRRWFGGVPSEPVRSDYQNLHGIIERMKAQQAAAEEIMTESDLQYDCVQALRELGLLVSASANGVKCSGRQMSQMKNCGLIPGWPDLTVIDRKGKHVYIELKTRKGHLSDEQVVVHEALQRRLCQVHVCRSVDEVVRLFA